MILQAMIILLAHIIYYLSHEMSIIQPHGQYLFFLSDGKVGLTGYFLDMKKGMVCFGFSFHRKV